MATLSVKLSARAALAFQALAESRGVTTSTMLRECIDAALRGRWFDVYDPEVGPPLGRLVMWLGDDDE